MDNEKKENPLVAVGAKEKEKMACGWESCFQDKSENGSCGFDATAELVHLRKKSEELAAALVVSEKLNDGYYKKIIEMETDLVTVKTSLIKVVGNLGMLTPTGELKDKVDATKLFTCLFKMFKSKKGDGMKDFSSLLNLVPLVEKYKNLGNGH